MTTYTELTIQVIYDKYVRTGAECPIIMNPQYQRTFVWSKDKCTEFIDSVMNGIPTPEIVLIENTDSIECMDGQNRLTCIANYLEKRNMFNTNDDDDDDMFIIKWNDMTYDQLSKKQQRAFNNCKIMIKILYNKDGSLDCKKELIFRRLQSGVNVSQAILVKNTITNPIILFLRDKMSFFNDTKRQKKDIIRLNNIMSKYLITDRDVETTKNTKISLLMKLHVIYKLFMICINKTYVSNYTRSSLMRQVCADAETINVTYNQLKHHMKSICDFFDKISEFLLQYDRGNNKISFFMVFLLFHIETTKNNPHYMSKIFDSITPQEYTTYIKNISNRKITEQMFINHYHVITEKFGPP